MKIRKLVPIALIALMLAIFGCGRDNSGSSADSSSPPASLTAIAGNSQVTLNWTPLTGAVSYNVYEGTTDGLSRTSGTLIGNCAGSPYTVTGLSNNTTYFFVVTAVDTAGEITESIEATATPEIIFPMWRHATTN